MTIKQAREKHYGFVTADTLPHIIAENPKQPLLIRRGNGREIVNAEDADARVKWIDNKTKDYVRDVSFPVV